MSSRNLPLADALLAFTILAGCTALKPLEARIADLKSRIARLNSDTQAAHRSADQAATAARSVSK